MKRANVILVGCNLYLLTFNQAYLGSEAENQYSQCALSKDECPNHAVKHANSGYFKCDE
jgi:hypothetical protein